MKNQASSTTDTQSGNIFFWLFLMILLFAGLSFALSKGMRTGATSLSEQQAKVLGQEIIAFGTQAKEAISAMRVNGCTVQQITFDNPAVAQYVNPSEPADGHCSLFKKAGGGLYFPKFSDDASDERLVFVGNHVQAEGGATFLGTVEPDLTVVREVDAVTCGAINKLLGNPIEYWDGASGAKLAMWESAGDHNGQRNQTTDAFSNFDPWRGSFSSTGGRGIRFRDSMTYNGSSYAGRVPPLTGCFCDSSTHCGAPVKYYFYNVLWVQ